METIRETAKSLIRQSLLDPILKGESNVETLKSQPIQKLLNSLEKIFWDFLNGKRKSSVNDLSLLRLVAALIYLNNVEATPQVNLVYLKQLLERKLTFDDQVVQDVLDISGSLRCLILAANLSAGSDWVTQQSLFLLPFPQPGSIKLSQKELEGFTLNLENALPMFQNISSDNEFDFRDMLREFKSDMIQLLANLALDLQGAPKAVKSPLKSPNKQLETHLAAHARDYRRETIAFSGPNTKQARIVTEQRLSPQRFVQKVNVSKKTKNTADYSLPQNLVKMLDRKPATTTIKILSRKDEFADSGANYMDPELRLFAIRSFGSKPNNVVPKPKRVAPWETKSAAIPISQLGGYYKDLVHQYSNRQ